MKKVMFLILIGVFGFSSSIFAQNYKKEKADWDAYVAKYKNNDFKVELLEMKKLKDVPQSTVTQYGNPDKVCIMVRSSNTKAPYGTKTHTFKDSCRWAIGAEFIGDSPSQFRQSFCSDQSSQYFDVFRFTTDNKLLFTLIHNGKKKYGSCPSKGTTFEVDADYLHENRFDGTTGNLITNVNYSGDSVSIEIETYKFIKYKIKLTPFTN